MSKNEIIAALHAVNYSLVETSVSLRTIILDVNAPVAAIRCALDMYVDVMAQIDIVAAELDRAYAMPAPKKSFLSRITNKN